MHAENDAPGDKVHDFLVGISSFFGFFDTPRYTAAKLLCRKRPFSCCSFETSFTIVKSYAPIAITADFEVALDDWPWEPDKC